MSFLQSHHITANIASRCFCCLASYQMYRNGCRCVTCETSYGLLTSGIYPAVMVTSNRYGKFFRYRCDIQPAICYLNRDTLIVCRSCCEIICLQTHIVLSSIGSFGFCNLFCFQSHSNITRCIRGISVHFLFVSCISYSVRVTSYLNHQSIRLSDGQITILYFYLNVGVVRGCCLKGICS